MKITKKMREIGGKNPLMLEDAIAFTNHINGKPLPPGYKVIRIPIPPTPAEMRTMRAKLKLSQSRMAYLINTPKKTYQNWEQGLRHPDGSTTLLLQLIETHPEVAGMLLELQGEPKAA